MAKDSNVKQSDSLKEGPRAPKDPVRKRSCIYIMLDSIIEASARNEGKPVQDIYLEGRLINKAMVTGGVTDESILKLLESCDGFHKLVHSIGVAIKSDKDETKTVDFILNNWGKVDKFSSGTVLKAACPLDGTEVILKLEDYEWSAQDDVLGKFAFEFDNPGDLASATVKFYLNDGYVVPELVIDPPVAFGSEDYKKMITKSVLNKGNNRRLKTVIDKARRGEDVTVAYIGGSITQGAGAKPINTDCYAYKSYLQFKKAYGKDGGDNVHFVKAGVGGTPSELGMLRYDRDILRDRTVEPDIVVIEFAVNDAGDETQGKCYESLALKALKGAKKPAVILLFSVFADDYNLQERLAPVGFHYNLPMVSVKDAVTKQFGLTKEQGNVISKRQYFYDIYHPTNDGHSVMADCISCLIAETDKAILDKEDIITGKAPAIGNCFTDVHLIDKKDNLKLAVISEGSFKETDKDLQLVEMNEDQLPSPQFPYNWMRTKASGKESFRMTIQSKSLVVVYKDSGSGDFGKADVILDGKFYKTLDPHENNWTHCNPAIIYQEEESSRHDVEIKMATGDEDKCFTILGFGYTL